MAIGNALSRNWDRPFKTDPSSYNTPQSRNREDAAFLSINGILNYKPDAKETATYLSRCLNGLQVDYYHSTTRGFITDILAAFIGKLGVQTSDSIEISMIMRRQIAFLKYATDTPQLFVFAHSRGGVYLDNALKLMTPEERKLIHAYTFGSASLFPNTGLSSLEHYVATGDPVPMTDPLNYLKGRISNTSNVHFLPGQGNFFTRHMVLEETYANQIKSICKQILIMAGE